jgi:hypothetical protein
MRSICESETLAERKFGINVARKLKRLLADFRAAETIADLVLGERIKVRSDEVVVSLARGYRIVICANHTSNPRRSDKSTNWARVSRIKILKMEDSHG